MLPNTPKLAVIELLFTSYINNLICLKVEIKHYFSFLTFRIKKNPLIIIINSNNIVSIDLNLKHYSNVQTIKILVHIY